MWMNYLILVNGAGSHRFRPLYSDVLWMCNQISCFEVVGFGWSIDECCKVFLRYLNVIKFTADTIVYWELVYWQQLMSNASEGAVKCWSNAANFSQIKYKKPFFEGRINVKWGGSHSQAIGLSIWLHNRLYLTNIWYTI